MEKNLFIKVIQNYPSTTTEEAKELLSLKESFPYSQLLHVLTARTCKDHGLSEQQNELQLAAVYAADRSILKRLMSCSADTAQIPGLKSSIISAVESPTNGSHNENDNLAEMVIRDVKELYNTRHKFELRYMGNSEPNLARTNISETEDTADHGKSKRERIIELSKALNAQPASDLNEPKPVKKKREHRKDLMDEIVDSKIKIEPENEKQKEQLEIIDHFIKAQPSISNAKDKPVITNEGDFDTIKTGEFGDNIVSETLVEILLKQGKKDKAIEVLKKLIWKFPQKKTYFAAQIEELKK